MKKEEGREREVRRERSREGWRKGKMEGSRKGWKEERREGGRKEGRKKKKEEDSLWSNSFWHLGRRSLSVTETNLKKGNVQG